MPRHPAHRRRPGTHPPSRPLPTRSSWLMPSHAPCSGRPRPALALSSLRGPAQAPKLLAASGDVGFAWFSLLSLCHFVIDMTCTHTPVSRPSSSLTIPTWGPCRGQAGMLTSLGSREQPHPSLVGYASRSAQSSLSTPQVSPSGDLHCWPTYPGQHCSHELPPQCHLLQARHWGHLLTGRPPC